MKRRFLFGWAVFLLFFLAACSSVQNDAAQVISGDRLVPPADYAGKENPLAADAQAVEEGKNIYRVYCAACHGDAGLGDGPVAASLEPKPAKLVGGTVSEAYLFWRISEGGLNSSMPAWKANLPEKQIWQLVSYLRTMK